MPVCTVGCLPACLPGCACLPALSAHVPLSACLPACTVGCPQVRDPKKRSTAEEVLKHVWVREDGVAEETPIQSEVVTRLQGFAAMNRLKRAALKVRP